MTPHDAWCDSSSREATTVSELDQGDGAARQHDGTILTGCHTLNLQYENVHRKSGSSMPP